ncbi:methyltransferase domain-containing protein [bacterium]|nr:methyltransferase domain-containing protein [bacterium]
MTGFEFDENVASQLGRLFQTESIRKLRHDYFTFFDVQPAEHVLDVGCGTGANAVALAEFLQGACRITGIDSSEPMLAIARHQLRNSPYEDRITYDSGDAHRLPYNDHTFDSVMMIQVLEYSKEPISLLRETMRVLKPGGKLFVADTDWDTIVWNSSFKERTRRIVLLWSDHEADGWQGRRIREYLIRSGFDRIQGELFHMSETSFAEGTYAFQLTNLITDYLIRSEKMSTEEIQEWVEDLRAKSAPGHFYFSLNRYAFVVHAPKEAL